MTQEQIEKAAGQFAFNQTPDATERYHIAFGFKKGANWRISSVWHNMDEKPDFKKKTSHFIEA